MLTKRSMPLILLPGTLCDQRVFAPMLAALGRAGEVLALAGSDNMPAMAQRMLASLPERSILCGFSLGAILALELVAQAPERIAGLVLIGGNARAMPEDRIASRRATLPIAEREGTASYIAGAWDASVPAWRHEDRAFRAELEAMAAATPMATFRNQIEMAINRTDSRPRLGAIAVPTLVICGEEDRVCPPELSREIAEGIPGAQLAIVERAGHYATLDQPVAVARHIADWLARSHPCADITQELS